jgi:hypothetical protein
MSTENQTEQVATMYEVVMTKEELLKHLTENKAKHDVVLATAIEGYWTQAREKVERRRNKFNTAIEEYKEDIEKELKKVLDKIEKKEELPQSINLKAIQINSHLGLVYTQDHTTDYDRAIRMMQSSVYDKVRLTTAEYDAYVLNNWSWKNEFIASAKGYVDSMRITKGVIGYSGAAGPKGFAGSMDIYQVANNAAISSITASGCAAF